jgi:hypothetical protein
MSEDEKRMKKQKIEDNRRLRSISILSSSRSSTSIVPSDRFVHFSLDQYDDEYSVDTNVYTCSLDDHLRDALTTVEKHYARAVRLNMSVIRGFDNPGLRRLNEFVDVANEPAYISSLRLITFFKLTPEFNVSRFNVIFVSVVFTLSVTFFSCYTKTIDSPW